MLALRVTSVLLTGLCTAAALAQSPPNPGQYATKGGWGNLYIEGREGVMHFKLETDNLNSGCTMEGQVQGSTGTAKLDEAVCKLSLQQRGQDIEVKSMTESCRDACGQNGSFEDTYTRLPSVCEDARLAAARNTFQRQYDQKKYDAARKTLAPVVQQCLSPNGQNGKVSFEEEGRIRNDYALVLYKLGDRSACQTVLAPYANDAKQSDEKLSAENSWAPAFERAYLPILKAARTNLRLCARR